MQSGILDKKIFQKYKLHHVIFWLLFGISWYNLYFYMTMDWWTNFYMTILEMATFALVIYFTNYFLIPKFIYTNKLGLFAFLFVLTIIAGSAANYAGSWFTLKDSMGPKQVERFWSAANIGYELIWMTLIGIAGGAVRFFVDQFKIQRALENMQKENAETELKFLKAQINPHFLFNCLNNIYFLINKENKEARQYLIKFSEMLRYQLYECNEENIPVEKEISYLRSYIETMKIRKGINYHIDFCVSENISGFKIAPLILVPFLENAFKHVSSRSTSDNLISISLEKQNGTLDFDVKNTTDEHDLDEIMASNGIGLKNVTRRLELLYPGKHELNIERYNGTYEVKLKLAVER